MTHKKLEKIHNGSMRILENIGINLQHNITVGGTKSECAAGYGSSQIIEKDGSIRASTFDDYINFIKL